MQVCVDRVLCSLKVLNWLSVAGYFNVGVSLSGPVSGPIFRLMTPWVIASSCLFTLLRQSPAGLYLVSEGPAYSGSPQLQDPLHLISHLAPTAPTICPGHVWILQPLGGGVTGGQKGQVREQSSAFQTWKEMVEIWQKSTKICGLQRKGRGIIVFYNKRPPSEARFKISRSRFFVQQEMITWHSLPQDRCGYEGSKGDWATSWQ